MDDPSDDLPPYLNSSNQEPPLTPEEERELARAARQGDEQARKRLIESNMRLVINIAKTYHNRAIPLEDLIQEGAIGLMQAAERFDPEKGYRFSTYATHWIRQAIGRAIDNKSEVIKLRADLAVGLRRVENERLRLVRELGSEPSLMQIAQAVGLSEKELLDLVRSAQDLLAPGFPVGARSQDVHKEDIVDELQRILVELNQREHRMMRLRYRVTDSGPSHEETRAQEPGLSRERIKQIEAAALERQQRLRREARARGLSVDVYFAVRACRAKRDELYESLGVEPTTAQIAKELRITEARVEELTELYRRHFTED